MPSVAAALPVPTIPRIPTGRHARNPVTITIPVTAMGRGGRAAPALSAAVRRLKKKHYGIFAGVSIRKLAKDWYAAPASGIAPGGMLRFQHRRALEFSGPPALLNNVWYWNVSSKMQSIRRWNSLQMKASFRCGWGEGDICKRCRRISLSPNFHTSLLERETPPATHIAFF